MKQFFFFSVLFFATLVFHLQSVNAAEIEIVGVHRNIQMSEAEPVYKDYYLNAGNEAFKKNLVVKAVRQVTVKNSGQKPIGDFKTITGYLKIIHVAGKVAVAREIKTQERDTEPVIDQPGIMIGDSIDFSESYIDKNPAK